jgi:hypothetical protein
MMKNFNLRKILFLSLFFTMIFAGVSFFDKLSSDFFAYADGWKSADVVAGAFCYDVGGPIYPLEGFKIKLHVVSSYEDKTITSDTDSRGITDSIHQTSHWDPNAPNDPRADATIFDIYSTIRDPSKKFLSTGAPYSQLRLRTDDVYLKFWNNEVDKIEITSYSSPKCVKTTYSDISAKLDCKYASPIFVFENCQPGMGPTPTPTPSGSGGDTYTINVTQGAGGNYYDDTFLFCKDGVLTVDSSLDVDLLGGDETLYIGAIEKSVVSGRLFDASDVDSCALFDLLPAALGSVFADGSTTDYTMNTNANGYYSQEVASPDTYLLTPSVGSGFVDLKFPCQGSAANFNPSLGGGEQIFNFGFWRQYGGWWKAIGGDVYGQGGVSSVIPASLAVEQSLLGADANGQDGLVWYGLGNDIYLGSNPNAFLSTSSFSAESRRRESLYDYDFFLSKMSTLPKTAWDGYGKPVFAPDGVDYQIYTHTGDVDFNFDVNSSEKMVFLVDGNVNVTGDVMTAVGGTLTIISSGTITFQPNVTDAQGQFLADQIVVAGSGADSSDPQFRGEGTFSGWYSISLERDRGDLNNSEPSEQFTFRPDFVVNAPAALKRSIYSWKEVAP